MSKIVLTDMMPDVMRKMSVGNPGALRVCMEILTQEGAIDPQAAMPGVGALLRLDDMGVYGSRIWMLYKDVCGEDLEKMLGVLRANQLGLLSTSAIYTAIENYGEGVDVDDLVRQVKERLPQFGKKDSETSQ